MITLTEVLAAEAGLGDLADPNAAAENEALAQTISSTIQAMTAALEPHWAPIPKDAPGATLQRVLARRSKIIAAAATLTCNCAGEAYRQGAINEQHLRKQLHEAYEDRNRSATKWLEAQEHIAKLEVIAEDRGEMCDDLIARLAATREMVDGLVVALAEARRPWWKRVLGL